MFSYPNAHITGHKAVFQQALLCHRQGRVNDAERLYRQILQAQATHAEAAAGLFSILSPAMRYADMEALAKQLLERAPRFGLAWKALSLALLQQGKDALHVSEMAAKYLPDDANAHDNLGLALKRAGRLEEAVASFRRAIKFQPRHAGVHINLANTLHQCGNARQALDSYRNALELDPRSAIGFNNMGNALRDLGQLAEAEASFRRAIALAPDFVEAHNNLGRVLKDMKRFVEAEASMQRALTYKPDFAFAHYNLACLYYDQGHLDDAHRSNLRALSYKPGNFNYRIAHAVFTLPVVPADFDDVIDAPVRFRQALDELERWRGEAGRGQARVADESTLPMPFYLAYRYGNHLEPLSRFGDLFADAVMLPREAPPRDKIRIAVVSANLRRHSVWDVIIHGWLLHLDRTRFEVVLYCLGQVHDEQTERARELADLWHDATDATTVAGWMRKLADDRPDVIFYPEIGMDAMTYGLASRRLAPLQVASWGHPITSGLPTIDLYFSGQLLETPLADTHYREELVRLPGTGCCTVPIEWQPQTLGDIATLLASRPGVRYVIAQTPFKIDPQDDALFPAIAAEVGECTFILFAQEQFAWATDRMVERMRQAFRERDLDPQRYLLVLP